MSDVVQRPLWRAFSPAELRAAVRHARAGGIAVVQARPWHLLGDAGPPGQELPLLVDWAIRAIEAPRWAEVNEGVARGCVKATIAASWRERVGEWIARDAAFSGATARATFSCMKCAACCYDNAVVLDDEDLARFRDAGDPSLLRRTRRKDGARLLLLRSVGREGGKGRERACIHLAGDLRCSIYPHRPNMCREFPAGTEQCMTSREDLYGSPFPPGR